MYLQEKILLRKRSIIETVNGVLKEDFQISHTRYRSLLNGFIHIFSTLIAYVLKSKKPSIKLHLLIPRFMVPQFLLQQVPQRIALKLDDLLKA